MLRRLMLLLLLCPPLVQAQALCPQSVTTVEMNQCLNIKLERAVSELDNNLDLLRRRFADNKAQLQLIEKSQQTWDAYRKKQCQSVFLLYEGGSLQSLMTVSCSIQLARQRNQVLRETYLQGR